MSEAALSEAEFGALIDRVVGALACAEGVVPNAAECAPLGWQPGCVGVDITCRDDEALRGAVLAMIVAKVDCKIWVDERRVLALRCADAAERKEG